MPGLDSVDGGAAARGPHVRTVGRIGLFSVAAIGTNTIVGSGIFRLPAELARELGPASILAYVCAALLLAFVALAFAEAGGMYARGGGAYLYAREAFGPICGCVVGWSAWVATVLTFATVAVAVPGELAEVAPGLAQPVAGKIMAVGLIAVLAAINAAGVRPAAWTSNVFLAAKLIALVLFVALGLPRVHWGSFSPMVPRADASLGPALLAAFFALSGFEAAAVPAGEASRPQRDVPLAVLGSLFGAAVLYVLVQIVAMGVLPDLGRSERPLADAARVFLGNSGARGVAVLGAVSMTGLCVAMALAGPRFLSALAEDGFLPPALARRDARRGAPRAAVFITAVATAAFALFYDFRRLVDFTSVVVVLQYLSTCLAIPALRIRRPALRRSFRLPLGPTIPLLGAGAMLWVLATASRAELRLAALVLASGGAIAVVSHRSWRAR